MDNTDISTIKTDTFECSATTTIKSEHAQKYLQVLCRHFSRKVEAKWNEHQGAVLFPVGTTMMKVDDERGTLSMTCYALNKSNLEAQKSIIDQHVNMFERRESIELTWLYN